MGDISKHLSRSEVACSCGCGFATADYELVNVIEDTCKHFELQNPQATRVAVHINSWCRCADHDLSVQKQYNPSDWRPSGKPSEHLRGWATDFDMEYVYAEGTRSKINAAAVATYLESRFPDRCGIGRYSNRTHFDMRNYKARWDKRT